MTTRDTGHLDQVDVMEALAFLRLVVRNNPRRTAGQIRTRPDVQEALEIVRRWVDGTRHSTSDTSGQSPEVPADNPIAVARRVLSRLADDTDLPVGDTPWAFE